MTDDEHSTEEETARAVEDWREEVRIARDPARLARVMMTAASLASEQGDRARARRLHEMAVELSGESVELSPWAADPDRTSKHSPDAEVRDVALLERTGWALRESPHATNGRAVELALAVIEWAGLTPEALPKLSRALRPVVDRRGEDVEAVAREALRHAEIATRTIDAFRRRCERRDLRGHK